MVGTTATAAAWVDALTRHGVMLLVGGTALLATGFVTMRLLGRAPVHRQRLGELTVGVTFMWLVLAAIPLPRLLSGSVNPGTEPSPAAPRTAPARDAGADARSDPRETPRPASNVGAEDGATPTDDLARLAGAITLLERSDLSWDDEPQPAPPPAAGRPDPWRTPARLVAATYLIGASACAAWLAIGYTLLARLLRAARPAQPWIQTEFDRLCRELLPSNWRGRRPMLRVTDACGRPMACGVLRPVVLLPADAADAAHAADASGPADLEPLRQVLRHELAHVRRRDAAGHALLNLALPLLYAHPLYWLVRRDVHLARELIADDWAAAGAPGGRAAYVEQLVAFARRATSSASGWHARSFRNSVSARAAVGLIGAFQTQTTFYRRMHMLLHRPPSASLATRCSPCWRLASWAGCLAALVCAAGLWGVSPARAEDQPTAPPSTEPAPPAPGGDVVPPAVEAAPPAPIEPAPPTAPAAEPAPPTAPAQPESPTPAPTAEGPAATPTQPAAAPTPENSGNPGAAPPAAPEVDEDQADRAEAAAEAHAEADAAAAEATAELAHAAEVEAEQLAAHQDAHADAHDLKVAEHQAQAAVQQARAALAAAEAQAAIARRRAGEHGEADRAIGYDVRLDGKGPRAGEEVQRRQLQEERARLEAELSEMRQRVGEAREHAAQARKRVHIELQHSDLEPAKAQARQRDAKRAGAARAQDALDVQPATDPAAKQFQPAARAEDPGFERRPGSADAWQSLDVIGGATAMGGGRGPGDSPYLDLVTLATGYIDAAGAVTVAEARLAQAEQNGSAVERRVEEANVENARRKAALLHAIAEVSLQGEQVRLNRVLKLRDTGAGSESEVAEHESRVKILTLIVRSKEGDAGDSPAAPGMR